MVIANMDNKSVLEEQLEFSQRLVNLLLENKGEDGICRIIQSDLALKLNRSTTKISKCINRLINFDRCIEKVKSGEYIVNEPDLYRAGPFIRCFAILAFLKENPEISYLDYIKQAKFLGITVKELQMAYGYLFLMISKSDIEKG